MIKELNITKSQVKDILEDMEDFDMYLYNCDISYSKIYTSYLSQQDNNSPSIITDDTKFEEIAKTLSYAKKYGFNDVDLVNKKYSKKYTFENKDVEVVHFNKDNEILIGFKTDEKEIVIKLNDLVKELNKKII